MKVRREGNGVVVFRNKRGGIRLRVEREISTKFPCNKCDLKTYQNSLCNNKSALCYEVRDRVEELMGTNFYFKI
jgi:hypothetical protein